MKNPAAIVLSILLVSCVNHSVIKPDPTASISVIELVSNYLKSSENSLISFSSFKKPLQKRNGTQEFDLWWCLDKYSSTNELKNFISQLCALKETFTLEMCAS